MNVPDWSQKWWCPFSEAEILIYGRPRGKFLITWTPGYRSRHLSHWGGQTGWERGSFTFGPLHMMWRVRLTIKGG